MPQDTFTPGTIGSELRRLAEEDAKACRRAMFRAANLARNVAVEQIGAVDDGRGGTRPLVDTGELRRGYKVTRLPDGAELENVAPHAPIQEYGTRPYTPPIEPLIAWARRKMRQTHPKAPRKVKPDEGQNKPVGPTPTRKQPKKPSLLEQATGAALVEQLVERGTDRRLGVAKRKAAAARERAIAQLARRAWNSIRRHGIRPKGYHEAASQKFPELVEQSLRHELGKVR